MSFGAISTERDGKRDMISEKYCVIVTGMIIKENSLTIGTQHSLDPLTTVKARVNNVGIASALLQHEWRLKSIFTILGEMGTRATEKSVKVGLALALKL
ncbi:hypothetical protein L1987_64507 [Smallanthus sonchifolius]|uniref:Uncharacterized protein n=2 Tax=Smallanthus sonchifolius TaxID=185202 RepID=A0ACB9CGA8_9ASTR|nr:hypothetical protein L1987_64506 [Smallanthus sonchifolius]KAI3733287.1 hypothetical protein L1987_64507 [Smallanthus sonchifolius]